MSAANCIQPADLTTFLSVFPARIPDFLLAVLAVPHWFRSSFKDWARQHDVDELLSEFALAHVEGSATVAAYARDDLLEKRRPVIQRWGGLHRGIPVAVRPGMRSHLGGCRSDGKLRVRADADQLEDVGILLAVHQDEIEPQVAVAVLALMGWSK